MAANKTDKLKLNIWLENEPVNFEEINHNFKEIDKLPFVVESGTKNGSYTEGTNSSNTWYYKKYSDNSIELYTKLEFDNLKCNNGSAAPYYSGTSKVTFPFDLKAVRDVQMHLVSNTVSWISNLTGKSVLDSISFRLVSAWKEDTTEYKQVFINVKGEL